MSPDAQAAALEMSQVRPSLRHEETSGIHAFASLRRTEDFGRLGQVHHFRLERPEDVDPALEALMREAYRVGTQELTARTVVA